jgi:hypothetical protein
MNFTKLYYPTAEAAYDDPNFITRLLADDTVRVELDIAVIGLANVNITANGQILYSGETNTTIQLDQVVDVIEKNILELHINLTSTNSSLTLTKCLIENFDMLVYPFSENVLVKTKNDQWIDTNLNTQGQLSLTVNNPIQLWAIEQAPNLFDRTLSSTFDTSVTQLHNKNIDDILKTML